MDVGPSLGLLESEFDGTLGWEAELNKLFHPPHGGVKICLEDAEHPLDTDFGLGSDAASSELSKSSLPYETAALTHPDLIPWESVSLTSVNSPSSCGTFSTAASRSSSTSSHPYRDYILALGGPGHTAPHDGNMKGIHKHPAKFQCTHCPKRFTRAYILRSHLHSHSEERPFVCAKCGTGFVLRRDLKRHEVVHLRGKGFVCMGDLNRGAQ